MKTLFSLIPFLISTLSLASNAPVIWNPTCSVGIYNLAQKSCLAYASANSNGLINGQIQPGINTQSGTTYTLVAADNGKTVVFTSSSAVTLTIPSGLVTGFSVLVIQGGSANVTLSAAGGVTLYQAESHTKTVAQGSPISIIGIASNTYTASGDMQ